MALFHPLTRPPARDLSLSSAQYLCSFHSPSLSCSSSRPFSLSSSLSPSPTIPLSLILFDVPKSNPPSRPLTLPPSDPPSLSCSLRLPLSIRPSFIQGLCHSEPEAGGFPLAPSPQRPPKSRHTNAARARKYNGRRTPTHPWSPTLLHSRPSTLPPTLRHRGARGCRTATPSRTKGTQARLSELERQPGPQWQTRSRSRTLDWQRAVCRCGRASVQVTNLPG